MGKNGHLGKLREDVEFYSSSVTVYVFFAEKYFLKLFFEIITDLLVANTMYFCSSLPTLGSASHLFLSQLLTCTCTPSISHSD